MNGEHYYPFRAIAPHFFAVQAVWRLCERANARFYLAVHHAVVVVLLGCRTVGATRYARSEEYGCTKVRGYFSPPLSHAGLL